MTPVADLLEVVLKSLTDRLALAGLFLAVLFILIAKAFPASAVGNWTNEHLVWAYGIGLFSLCYLPTRAILEKTAAWSISRKQQKRLHSLVPDEKRLLSVYIDNNLRTHHVYSTDGTARGLAHDGILYIPDVEPYHGHTHYNIQDWVRLYLIKHPDLLTIPEEKN